MVNINIAKIDDFFDILILGIMPRNVEYWYLLSQWFAKDEYKDVRDYIISVGCRFFFEYTPLKELGLSVPK